MTNWLDDALTAAEGSKRREEEEKLHLQRARQILNEQAGPFLEELLAAVRLKAEEFNERSSAAKLTILPSAGNIALRKPERPDRRLVVETRNDHLSATWTYTALASAYAAEEVVDAGTDYLVPVDDHIELETCGAVDAFVERVMGTFITDVAND